MTDVADLRIRVESQEAAVAEKRLDGLTRAGGKAERATGGLTSTIARMASVAAVGALALAGLRKAIATQREFDVINAGLITATGSAQNAAEAFEALQEFAENTPYDLAQVSTSFTKLVNLGLTPSERALTSYGNTASAMGKDLNMLIEAVADAATGEFERLKEFGIKAKQQGDNVSLTFRGVTTTIGKNASEIEDYLIALGENEFAGAMAQRMDSLDGKLSNLADEWDSVFRNIMGSSIGDGIEGMVESAVGALGALNEYLASGELEGNIDVMAAQWGPWAESAQEATSIIWDTLQGLSGDIEKSNPQLLSFLSSAWKEFPQNVKAFIEIATVEFAASLDYWKNQAVLWTDEVAAIFTSDTIADAQARYVEAQARVQSVRADMIDDILKERQTTTDAAAAARKASEEKIAQYRKEKAEKDAANAGKDRLARFGQDPVAPKPGGAGDKAGAAEAKRRQKAFESLVESLRTEEEEIQASYTERRSIIEAGTTAESDLRRDLMGRLDEWRAQGEQDITDSQSRELENVRRSLMTQEEAIEASYAKRKQIVLDSLGVSDEVRAQTLARLDKERAEDLAREQADRQGKRDSLLQDFMTREELALQSRDRLIQQQQEGEAAGLISHREYLDNKRMLEEEYSKTVMQLQLQRQSQTYDMYAGLFGSMSQLADTFAQGQGKSAERAFKISKALAYAQAVMSTAAGVSRALADNPAPASYVYAAMAAVKGATEIATISQQKFSGAYDKGGRIPAGSFGVVGEKGMEVVSGPANVTGREDTARLLRQAAEGGGGDVTTNNVVINVHLAPNGSASSTTDVRSNSTNAEDAKRLGGLIDERVRSVLLKEQRQGGMLSKNR